MLGSMLVDFFSQQKDYSVTASVRNENLKNEKKILYPEVKWIAVNANHEKSSFYLDEISGFDWIINAIGVTKPLIKDDEPESIARAIFINSVFPEQLAKIARTHDARVIQIATDCVYSGSKGNYNESDVHDAYDVYGKTKSLGECFELNVKNLRCSIIGPEIKDHKFLLDWFLQQPRGAALKGFSNHEWNGITTLHFAKLCHGIIKENIELPHIQHIIPEDKISKADMLKAFAAYYGRQDISIETVNADMQIDRTLSTENKELNLKIWHAAGYERPPTIEKMIEELSQINFKEGAER